MKLPSAKNQQAYWREGEMERGRWPSHVGMPPNMADPSQRTHGQQGTGKGLGHGTERR